MNIPIIAYRANMGVQTSSPFSNTYSLDFDGMDDYVGTNSKIIGSDITLSAWVNFNGGSYAGNMAQFPMSITPSNTNVPNQTIGRFFKVGVNMRISIQCYDQNGANFSTYTVPALNFEGAGWQHVCWTYNVTTKHIYVYINGVAQNWLNFSGSVTTPYLTAISGSIYESDLTIGRQKPTASTGTYLGLVDEVSTYNRILTQEEITSISAAPTDLSGLNPIAWLRNGDNGSYKSPQWLIPNNENKDKVSNYSFEFDGMDDYIDVGTSLNLGTDSTISMWIKRGRVSTTEMLLGEDTYSFDLTSYIDASNTLIFKVGTFNSTFNASPISTILNDTTNWIHICWVRSGDSVELFLNGASMQTKTGFGALVDTRFDTIAAKPTGALPFLGNIDEVAAWDTNTINPIDIYNGGEPTTLPSGAVAHYKLGEEATFSGGVWTVPDAVGSNDGTSNAMTIEDRVGEAPNSTDNAVSFNMDLVDRVTDTP